MDPLSFVFITGAAAMTAIITVPAGLAMRMLHRRKGKKRNHQGCCSRCARPWSDPNPLHRFQVEGLWVCERCGTTLRRRLWFVLPATALLGGVVAVGATAGVLLGGPDLAWWLNWRALPLILPSVAVVGGLFGGVALMKRANRRIGEGSTDDRHVGPGGDQPRIKSATS